MARDLTEQDYALLRKLVPEYAGGFCPGSGHAFHSVLPPVSNHFSADAEDFKRRISVLSDEDWAYLAALMEQGEESLGCMPEEDVEAVLGQISRRVAPDIADRIRRLRDLIECGVL